MRQGLGIRGRLLLSFLCLALGICLFMGLAGYFSYVRLGRALVEWQARPVMEALIEAETRAWAANDRGFPTFFDGNDLAAVMQWRFLVGKQIPQAWETLPDGLHFPGDTDAFVLVSRRHAITYALSGRTGAYATLKAQLGGLLLLCAVLGLGAAACLGIVLSLRLTRPLMRLTRAVRGQGETGGAATPIDLPRDLCRLDDEVGILARALAAREEELARFVRRETCFTGDVSHELRTPLTVLQGGLEVLELRLAALPEQSRKGCEPVLARLSRTVAQMTATVRALLLLARRPETLERCRLPLHEILHDMTEELVAGGAVCHAADASGAPSGAPVLLHCQAETVEALGQRELVGIVFKNLLDNACRYTENGRVDVRLAADALHVVNGGAIPEDLDIFARGIRGADHAPQRAQQPPAQAGARSGGSGLGLSLALRACEQLGWRLVYSTESAPDTPPQTVFRVFFSGARE